MRPALFPGLSRCLHWLMAVLIIAMLFIGIGMVASVSPRYAMLVSLHRPLGLAILCLALVRLVNRWLSPPPQLPNTVPPLQRRVAQASQYLLYALMLGLPLVGWAMLSAAPYPIVAGPLHLPPLMAPNPVAYAWLRRLHTDLALLLFATILLHIAGALVHALIRRDGVFESMASLARRRP